MQNRFLRRVFGALFLAAIFLFGYAGSSPPPATLRVHVQTENQGAMGTQIVPVTLYNPNKQIMVRAQPELSERDVVKVESSPSDVANAMRITFSEHGRIVLNTFTMENQNRIMVVFLNGRVVYAPVIDKVVLDGTLIIPRGVVEEEVMQLRETAKKVNKR